MSPSIEPSDVHNRELVSQVHPPEWTNPTSKDRYNLVVIGGGTAGLVTAAGAAGLGARVALVERQFLGGDCLNFGCVPSKALLRSARAAAEVRRAAALGVCATGISVDFGQVMSRLRELRARISRHDSAARFRSLGVDVYLGDGRFLSPKEIEVGGQVLRFARAVIATGGRAAVPELPGLAAGGFLTNETVFSLTELPRRLAVIGGGPIGCELAQAFARLGSTVTLFHRHGHLLDREDPEAAHVIEQGLKSDGVQVLLDAQLQEVARSGGGRLLVHKGPKGIDRTEVDAILLAAGRVPNVTGLGLEAAGVAFDPRTGVVVNDRLQTTQSRIYACGDVCFRHKFTHAADATARIVIQNALFHGRKRASRLTVPWCTFTDPEVARIGLNDREAAEAGVSVDAIVRPLAEVDRARLDGDTDGFVKILVARGTDRIVGSTVVARNAGDLIGEIGVAMTQGIGLGRLASVIHPYPTHAEAIRQCGDAWNRKRLTPSVKALFERWLAWTR